MAKRHKKSDPIVRFSLIKFCFELLVTQNFCDHDRLVCFSFNYLATTIFMMMCFLKETHSVFTSFHSPLVLSFSIHKPLKLSQFLYRTSVPILHHISPNKWWRSTRPHQFNMRNATINSKMTHQICMIFSFTLTPNLQILTIK